VGGSISDFKAFAKAHNERRAARRERKAAEAAKAADKVKARG
jgi:hypothetical protein